MQEKNLQRAKDICNALESYRKEISNIKNVKVIDSAKIEFLTTVTDTRGQATLTRRDVNLISLGNDILKFILNQKRLYLQGRILELEAELRNL